MAAIWTAQEPAREEWDERNGKRFAVDVLNDAGMLVCTAFADTAHVAMQRAMRVARRAA